MQASDDCRRPGAESDLAILVSIGLPVRNGERFLRAAIDSLLAQDHRNIELIISDNASEDATPALCFEYVKRDSRVRYIRQATILGPAENFQRVFSAASGEYFMWAADDDVRAPEYVSSCLSMLRSHPDAVLCATHVRTIDAEGRDIADKRPHVFARSTEGLDVYQRLERMFAGVHGQEVYGILRTSAVQQLDVAGTMNRAAGDWLLLVMLSIMGTFVRVEEHLLYYRSHAAQYSFELESQRERSHIDDLTDLWLQIEAYARDAGLDVRRIGCLFGDQFFADDGRWLNLALGDDQFWKLMGLLQLPVSWRLRIITRYVKARIQDGIANFRMRLGLKNRVGSMWRAFRHSLLG